MQRHHEYNDDLSDILGDDSKSFYLKIECTNDEEFCKDIIKKYQQIQEAIVFHESEIDQMANIRDFLVTLAKSYHDKNPESFRGSKLSSAIIGLL